MDLVQTFESAQKANRQVMIENCERDFATFKKILDNKCARVSKMIRLFVDEEFYHRIDGELRVMLAKEISKVSEVANNYLTIFDGCVSREKEHLEKGNPLSEVFQKDVKNAEILLNTALSTKVGDVFQGIKSELKRQNGLGEKDLGSGECLTSALIEIQEQIDESKIRFKNSILEVIRSFYPKQEIETVVSDPESGGSAPKRGRGRPDRVKFDAVIYAVDFNYQKPAEEIRRSSVEVEATEGAFSSCENFMKLEEGKIAYHSWMDEHFPLSAGFAGT